MIFAAVGYQFKSQVSSRLSWSIKLTYLAPLQSVLVDLKLKDFAGYLY